ncbi:hypothetical protein GN316_21075 [Xylophilus sp. Kf1]|nr:hypothetical protein [Xylophilus sp. Kf1]
MGTSRDCRNTDARPGAQADMSFSPKPVRPIASLVLLALAAVAAGRALAQGACSSDGAPAPGALVERFLSDRCDDCWRSRPAAGVAGTLSVDWIVPSGDVDAALAPAALPEAAQRLQSLGLVPDSRSRETRHPVGRASAGRLRLAQGPVVNDYLGVSMAWKPAGRRAHGLRAWLLLVEEVPAGVAGTPVARRLVRAAWSSDGVVTGPTGWDDRRAMRVPAGADPTRLRLVGWLEEPHGAVVVAATTRCAL